MLKAEFLRSGLIIRLEGKFYKVISSIYHKATAKMGSMAHSKLRNLETGTTEERRFSPDEKLEDIVPERITMQYVYSDEKNYVFMNPDTFEQITLEKKATGQRGAYLKENINLPVEFYEDKPLDIIFPEVVEMKVISTGAGLKGQAESTYKEAVLENGISVMVPQFIKTGDTIRVEVETNHYLERVTEKPRS